MNLLNKIIEYGLYLLVFLLPVQTRWIIRAGLNEYQTYSLYGTDILLMIILGLFVFVIPASEPESRGKTHKLKIFKEIFLNIINVFNSIIPTVHSWIAGQARNDKGKLASINGKKAWWFIGGLLLIAAVSVFSAADKSLALYKLGWLLLGAGLFWLMVKADYNRLKLIYALLAGIFLQAGLGIWQFFTQSSFANKWLGLALHNPADLGVSVIEALGADGAGERWLRAYGGLDHPNILGGMLAIGIILIIYLVLVEEESFGITNYELRITNKIQNAKLINIKLLTSYFLLLTFSAALFFTFSRSAWLALTAGLAVMIIGAAVKKDLTAQKSLAKIILIIGVLFFTMFIQHQNLIISRLGGEGRLENKSVAERLASYGDAGRIIKNNWLLGVGPGNYTLALSRELPGRTSYFYQPAHNAFLLAWAETGVLGLIFFVALLFVIARRLKTFCHCGLDPQSRNLFRAAKLDSGSGAGMTEEVVARNDNGVAILIALIVLLSLDHWLFSLHFGVLFFWLLMGMASRKDEKLNPSNPPLTLSEQAFDEGRSCG